MRLGLAIAILQCFPSLILSQVHPDQLPVGADCVAVSPIVVNDTSERTVQLLADELSKANTREQRVRLIGDLAKTEKESARLALRPLIVASDEFVSAEAVRALGTLRDFASSKQLEALYPGSKPLVRAEIIRAARKLENERLVQLGLDDEDESVRLAAIETSWTAQHAKIISTGFKKLSSDTIPDAIDALVRCGQRDSVATIASCASSTDAGVLTAVLRAFSSLQANDQFAMVEKLQSHTHPSVRREAVLAMRGTCSREIRQARAILMLADADMTVRKAAAELLKDEPTDTAVEALAKQLGESYMPLHDEAREALVAACGEGVAVQLLSDPTPLRRIDGSYILGKLKSASGIERHIELLKETDWAVAAQAAESIGNIGQGIAGEAIGELVRRSLPEKGSSETDSSRASAGHNAIVAAVKIGYPILDQVRPLIRRRNTPVPIRIAAIWALGITGKEQDSTIFDYLLTIQADAAENPQVQLEGIKAIGNANAVWVKDRFMASFSVEQIQRDYALFWTANRLNQTHGTFIPPKVRRSLNLTVQDQGQAK